MTPEQLLALPNLARLRYCGPDSFTASFYPPGPNPVSVPGPSPGRIPGAIPGTSPFESETGPVSDADLVLSGQGIEPDPEPVQEQGTGSVQDPVPVPTGDVA